MNENSKTIALVVAAAAVLCLAFITRPAPPTAVEPAIVGKSLFSSLDDPTKAKRLKIVTFDETTSQPKEFEVAQVNGVWSLPSHHNYPADAKEQLAAAATALMNLKVLGPVGSKGTQDEHELYGVVEPKPAEDQFGQLGLGKLVEVDDENGKSLAKIIIGKPDKPNKPDEMESPGAPAQLRFVRVPGQDQVYRVKMQADKFSTNFADWIETDLLKINPWDVTDVNLRDYSVVDTMTPSGLVQSVLDQRSDADLTFDDKTQKWTLKDLVNYKDEKPKQVKLADDEELNTAKLNDLKSALNNLKIIDVARKPAQMSANLKADKDFTTNSESMLDLRHRGFHAQPVGDGSFDIVSNDGEAVVSMKDGVQYVLRFGAVAGIDTGSDDKKKAAGDDKKTDDAQAAAEAADNAAKQNKNGGLSRYIMVMAKFNPNLIPKPDLEPVPEIKKSSDKSAAAKAASPEKKPDAKAAATKSDAKSPEAKATDAKAADAKATAKAAESKAAEGKAAGKEAAGKEAEPKTSGDEDLDAQEAEHDRVEKENRRKQEAYDEKIKQGEHRAKELNARFADWYYVVGEDTYKKIHLGQADLIKKKAKDDKDAKGAAALPPGNPFNLNMAPAGKAPPAAK